MSEVKERTARAARLKPARGDPGISPRTPRKDNVRPAKQPWGPRPQPGWMPSNPTTPSRPPSIPWKRIPTVPEVKRFIRRNPRLPGMDAVLRPWINRMPPSQALEVLDYLYDLWRRQNGKFPQPRPSPAQGWQRGGYCSTYRNPTGQNMGSAAPPSGSIMHPFTNACLSGQLWPLIAIGTPLTNGVNVLVYGQGNGAVPERFAHTDSWWRQPGVLKPGAQFVVGFAQGLNPNTERYFPGIPEPNFRPADPETSRQAEVPYRHRRRVFQTEPSPRVQRPIRPHSRTAPPPGTKEGKFISKTARFGIALFKILDHASEVAEFIDAIYEALPEDVKKRWNRPSRPGDSFGQYGLGGADWKGQAIFHNFDKVDWELAFQNIVKNGLQDAVYGAIYKGLPKESGNALDPSFKALEDWMNQFFYDEIINTRT